MTPKKFPMQREMKNAPNTIKDRMDRARRISETEEAITTKCLVRQLREHRKKASRIVEYRTTNPAVVDAVRMLDVAADALEDILDSLENAEVCQRPKQ